MMLCSIVLYTVPVVWWAVCVQFLTCCCLQSEWKGPTAGGCSNFPTFSQNPQFVLTVRCC